MKFFKNFRGDEQSMGVSIGIFSEFIKASVLTKCDDKVLEIHVD